MKTAILIAALTLSIGANAQTIQVDSRTNYSYAEIDSLPITGMSGVYATKIMIKVTDLNYYNATIHWEMQYDVRIDSNTVNTFPLYEGNLHVPVTSAATLAQSRVGAFTYVRANATINNLPLYFTYR